MFTRSCRRGRERGPVVATDPMHFLGIDWVGAEAANCHELHLSLAFIAIVLWTSWLQNDRGAVAASSDARPLYA